MLVSGAKCRVAVLEVSHCIQTETQFKVLSLALDSAFLLGLNSVLDLTGLGFFFLNQDWLRLSQHCNNTVIALVQCLPLSSSIQTGAALIRAPTLPTLPQPVLPP